MVYKVGSNYQEQICYQKVLKYLKTPILYFYPKKYFLLRSESNTYIITLDDTLNKKLKIYKRFNKTNIYILGYHVKYNYFTKMYVNKV